MLFSERLMILPTYETLIQSFQVQVYTCFFTIEVVGKNFEMKTPASIPGGGTFYFSSDGCLLVINMFVFILFVCNYTFYNCLMFLAIRAFEKPGRQRQPEHHFVPAASK